MSQRKSSFFLLFLSLPPGRDEPRADGRAHRMWLFGIGTVAAAILGAAKKAQESDGKQNNGPEDAAKGDVARPHDSHLKSDSKNQVVMTTNLVVHVKLTQIFSFGKWHSSFVPAFNKEIAKVYNLHDRTGIHHREPPLVALLAFLPWSPLAAVLKAW